MSFTTTIANVTFPHCIFNASGPICSSLEELQAIGKSGSAAIMTKSCTFTPRDGNPEPRYTPIPYGSINSMGLPNLGYEAYIKMIPELKQFKKPVVCSVSGMKLEDNIAMIKAFNETDADLLELNLSCPNIVGKPQVGYDFAQANEVLEAVMKTSKKPLGVKLPPYFDFVHFEQMAAILNRHNVAFVSCINSIGNALFINPETEQVVIKPKGGFGGLGGDYVKPTALANVHKFRELLHPSIHIIGVGGIKSGMDVFEFILAGADAVQIGTQFMEEGPSCFTRIEAEFNAILHEKGYDSLAAFKGRLRPLS